MLGKAFSIAAKYAPRVAETVAKSAPVAKEAVIGAAKTAAPVMKEVGVQGVNIAKGAGKTVLNATKSGVHAASVSRAGGARVSRAVFSGMAESSAVIGQGVLNSKAVTGVGEKLAGMAAGSGAGAKAAGVASRGFDKLIHSRMAQIGTTGALGATALYATGHGDVVTNVVDATANVAQAGANALTHIPNAINGTSNVLGSGADAIADLAECVTGIASDITSGDFGNIANRLGTFVSEHPLASAIGVGGGALMFGNVGTIGKIALAGAGFIAAKTAIEKNATGADATKVVDAFATGDGTQKDVTQSYEASSVAADQYDMTHALEQAATQGTSVSGLDEVVQTDMPHEDGLSL